VGTIIDAKVDVTKVDAKVDAKLDTNLNAKLGAKGMQKMM